MVILETAAITAAGYGLYRGGDAAVRKGKDTHKELVRERVRQSQRSELRQKAKTRQDRVSELLQLRNPRSSSSNSTSSTSLTSSSGSSLNNSSSNSSRNINPSTSTASAVDDGLSGSSSLAIEDRHKNVMDKLRSSRGHESNTSSRTKRLGGLFGAKK
jgi:hypothetical protein